jgi:hypothetical protein
MNELFLFIRILLGGRPSSCHPFFGGSVCVVGGDAELELLIEVLTGKSL